jgi:hypothetical protein
MSAFSVFTGAVYLLVFSPLSHRPPHPETYSVGAVPLLYIILVQYHAWLRRKPLNGTIKSTYYKHKNTGAGLYYSGRNGQWSLPY